MEINDYQQAVKMIQKYHLTLVEDSSILPRQEVLFDLLFNLWDALRRTNDLKYYHFKEHYLLKDLYALGDTYSHGQYFYEVLPDNDTFLNQLRLGRLLLLVGNHLLIQL